MNTFALKDVALTFNEMKDAFEPDSLYLWIRDVLTMATCNSLLGSHNPMKSDKSLVEALWDFDAGVFLLVLNIMPSIVAPKTYKARETLQAALRKYYGTNHDLEPDVAELIKVRAAYYKKYDLGTDDTGNFELALLNVSTANAIPTVLWLVAFIVSDPALIASIREELQAVITISEPKNGKLSSYREVIRLINSQLGTRRVMADTIISDEKSTYLLRKGWDIQIPAGVPHRSTEVWGPNAASFDARRFMKLDTKSAMSEKAKEEKQAYIPLGGGKHLCPGRNFAFAEMLGFIATLIVGFDVKAKDGGLITVPYVPRTPHAVTVSKPVGKGLEMGAKITRRAGWEDVVWQYIT
ncbi:related to cytochrome P450 7B1 [Rhynchosporium secalis]|uniref:Related to cytochrome P450 7B1 n=1 Tax=Rhynchosporium secalis TaxID=38038 RepID=A0A1E1M3Z6_RHYSE|nr:related to cytochrome P450 7B1 [Rhynchosporium secalis]